jgi:hypothetical protein
VITSRYRFHHPQPTGRTGPFRPASSPLEPTARLLLDPFRPASSPLEPTARLLLDPFRPASSPR